MKKRIVFFGRFSAIKTYFVSIILFLLIPLYSLSQSTYDKIEVADENFEALAYLDARAIYLDVAREGYESENLFRRLGDAFYFTGDLAESVIWYEKLLLKYPEDVHPEYLFRYAQSLKSEERYDDSDKIMETFNKITSGDKRAKSYTSKKNYLNDIENKSGKYEIYSLNINSKYSDYAPSFYANNNLVFATSRSKTDKNTALHNWTKMPFLDLYKANVEENHTKLSKPEKLNGKINTKFHESSSSFSKDGKTVYFTRNNFNKNRIGKNNKGITGLKIYKAIFEENTWSKIKELPFCSHDYSVSHPSLSPDGKQLYFASDMPGTHGQSDLYVVDILPNGKYGKPKNLGNQINTEGRETFPYISETGILYFASDGHVGLGGLDIFMATKNETGSYEIHNLGKPVNSPKDDFSFVIKENTRIGYFASNRKGGKGSDDIYSFIKKEDIQKDPEICQEYIKGKIIDNETEQVVSKVNISLLDIEGKVLQTTTSNLFGRYKFTVACNTKYIIQISSEGYVPKDTTVDTKETPGLVLEVPILFEKEKLLSSKTPVKAGDDLMKVLELDNIYFDLNQHDIRSDARLDLQKLIVTLKKYPKINIEIRSHTDSRSSQWYNKKLSEKRMRATKKYIVKNGKIKKKRIKGAYYGETKLTNDCADGTPCSEYQHQQNRRSEFIVSK